MEEANKKKLSAQGTVPVSEIGIGIQVEIGSLELSVQDLIDLSSGQTFEYEFDPMRPVTLCVGEEKIAQARFVQEDDRLLLQIVDVQG